jgi:hypothetical protein
MFMIVLYDPLLHLKVLRPSSHSVRIPWKHWRMTYKDTKPYMSAFLSVDLLTEFAAFCLTDFIDWRYIHSWPSLWTVSPMDEGTMWYLCTLAPLLYLFSDLLPPSPLPNVQYIQTVCVCRGVVGGCWNVLWTIFCRSFTLCFWPYSEPTKLLHHPKQKWPVKTTLRDWCL